MTTNDGQRTNLASSKIQTSRSWNYWFESNSDSDVAACWFYILIKEISICQSQYLLALHSERCPIENVSVTVYVN